MKDLFLSNLGSGGCDKYFDSGVYDRKRYDGTEGRGWDREGGSASTSCGAGITGIGKYRIGKDRVDIGQEAYSVSEEREEVPIYHDSSVSSFEI